MKLLTPKYLPEYRKAQRSTLAKHLARIERKGAKHVDFQRWARIAGAIASSQIEGSTVTVEEYMSATEKDIRASRDLRQVQELISTYEFATKAKPTEANLLKAHGMLANTLSGGRWKPGEWRTGPVFVVKNSWPFRVVVYTAADADQVPDLMAQLMAEVEALNKRELSNTEVFYYASLLHLQFVKIHPFSDGNGRTARLLEKWFMARHLGHMAWWINSELYYRMHMGLYSGHLAAMGKHWESVNMDRALPFLLLLPRSLRQK